MSFLRYDPDSSDYNGYNRFTWQFIGLYVVAYITGVLAGVVGLDSSPVDHGENLDRGTMLVLALLLYGIPVIVFAIIHWMIYKIRRTNHLIYKGILRHTWLLSLLLSLNSTFALASAVGDPTPAPYRQLMWVLVLLSVLGVILATSKGRPQWALVFATVPLLAWPISTYYDVL